MKDSRDTNAIEALEQAFAAISHDLWSGDTLNVAPTRIEDAQRLKEIGADNFGDRDLDYVMFKAMSTMGGVATFKAFLPRFLKAVLADPSAGWTTDGQVLLGKLEAAEFDQWPTSERWATAAALKHFAEQLIVLDIDDADVWALHDWAELELARAT